MHHASRRAALDVLLQHCAIGKTRSRRAPVKLGILGKAIAGRVIHSVNAMVDPTPKSMALIGAARREATRLCDYAQCFDEIETRVMITKYMQQSTHDEHVERPRDVGARRGSRARCDRALRT